MLRRYLSERFPWLNLTYSLAAAFAIALLIVATWPHSQLVVDLVVITALPGTLGAILWGMTFWAKARVQIGRRKLRYRSVRRIGGLAALFCLPFLLLQQASIYLRGPILPAPAPEPSLASAHRPGDKQPPSRVVVAIAHLEGDSNQQVETRLRDAFASLDSRLLVSPIILNRTISLAGRPQGIAHLDALGAATDARAFALIWGATKSGADTATAKLYVSSFGDSPSFGGAYLPDDFKLPELPLDDLSKVSSLVVATISAKLMAQSKLEFGDVLRPLIAQVRALADDPGKTAHWSTDTRARVNLVLSVASRVSGIELRSEDSIRDAVAYLRKTQSDWTREQNPLEWALAQRNLGSALDELSGFDHQDATVQAAIVAYQNALAVYEARSDEPDAARMQFELGGSFYQLGTEQAGSSSMRRSADYYRAALKGSPIGSDPWGWAVDQYNIGNSLYRAANQDASAKEFDDAIAAAREALKVFEQLSPVNRTRTQDLLSSLYEERGDLNNSRDDIKQSISLCRQGLQEVSRESNPRMWSGFQSTMGNALITSYRLDKDPKSAQEAEAAFRAALETLSKEDDPSNWAISKGGLGRAQVALGEANSDAHSIELGIDSLNEALKAVTRERDPIVWAWTKFDLANALEELGKRDGAVVHFRQAIDNYHEILALASKDAMPDLFAEAQARLKIALNDLHQHGSTGT